MSGSPITISIAATPTPLEVFRARCEAHATLYAAGEIPDLHDAVDALQEHAERHGLVAEIGQDAVQQVISEAFRPVRAGEASGRHPRSKCACVSFGRPPGPPAAGRPTKNCSPRSDVSAEGPFAFAMDGNAALAAE